MGFLQRVSLLCGAAFLVIAVILGMLITRAFGENATDARIWSILLGAFPALFALLFGVVRKAGMFAEQQDLSRRLVSLMNNVPGAVYRGTPASIVRVVG